jgi:hypothetical protein
MIEFFLAMARRSSRPIIGKMFSVLPVISSEEDGERAANVLIAAGFARTYPATYRFVSCAAPSS